MARFSACVVFTAACLTVGVNFSPGVSGAHRSKASHLLGGVALPTPNKDQVLVLDTGYASAAPHWHLRWLALPHHCDWACDSQYHATTEGRDDIAVYSAVS